MRRRAEPAAEPFAPEFQQMLAQVLRHGGRILGARREVARSRHQALVQSGTFAGHRPYAPGDDLRRIDWNAYARTGSLFVKVLTENERRATTVLLDHSASMQAGQPPRWLTAQRLAAILGGLALVHLDGVAVVTEGCESFRDRATLSQLLEHLRAVSPIATDGGDPATTLARARAPGKVHWISDFADPAATERALLRLRRLGFFVTGWLPTIAADFAVAAGGWTTIVDPETGHELRLRVDKELAAAMTQQLQVLGRQQDRAFAASGFPLQRFTVADGDFAAAHWLEAGWSFRR